MGAFNGWDEEANPLEKISDGVWECYLPFVLETFDIYKFCITSQDGKQTLKSDPYAFHFETAPNNASRYYELEGCHEWHDEAWKKRLDQKSHYNQPMNIYEVHPVSYTHLDVYKRQIINTAQ